MNKIIQKDITFDLTFNQSIFTFGKFLKQFEKYNVEKIYKDWSIWKPFRYTGYVRINIQHDINVDEMRQKQHELIMKGNNDETNK